MAFTVESLPAQGQYYSPLCVVRVTGATFSGIPMDQFGHTIKGGSIMYIMWRVEKRKIGQDTWRDEAFSTTWPYY